MLRIAAFYGQIPKTTSDEARPISRGSVNGRAVVERKTIHIHDLAAESDTEYPEGKTYQKRFGHRTIVATPLLREGIPIGAITIRRMEVRPFSEKEINSSRPMTFKSSLSPSAARARTSVRYSALPAL